MNNMNITPPPPSARGLKHIALRCLLLAFLFSGFTASMQAAITAVTFDFTSADGDPLGKKSFDFTSDIGDITLTVSTDDNWALGGLFINSKGMVIGDTGSDGKSYNLVFNVDVTLDAFLNGTKALMGPDDGFRVSVAGSTDETFLRDSILKSQWNDFKGQVVPAGTQITFWSINPSNASLSHYMSGIRVLADVVPEPSTYALILGACLMGFTLFRRRRH